MYLVLKSQYVGSNVYSLTAHRSLYVCTDVCVCVCVYASGISTIVTFFQFAVIVVGFFLLLLVVNTNTNAWAVIYRLWCWSWKRLTHYGAAMATRQHWEREPNKRRAKAVEKIAVKCCKVTTVYIRSWIAEESTRVFQFRVWIRLTVFT